jgi:hypothetical protein
VGLTNLFGGLMKTEVSVLSINGVDYVPKNSQPIVQPSGPAKIIILQRGWIMVGRLERNGSDCKLHNASTIRSWGTTKGLGEIASNGPTSKTLLDKCHGVVEFDYLTVVASISVEESKWANVL